MLRITSVDIVLERVAIVVRLVGHTVLNLDDDDDGVGDDVTEWLLGEGKCK